MTGVLVIGAGGHAKVVADIFRCCGVEVAGFLDSDPARWNTQFQGLPILGAPDDYADFTPHALTLAIGSNAVRRDLARRLNTHRLWRNAVHPGAIVSPSARLGQGVMVCPAAVVGVDTRLGDHVIINTSASVDHDCEIGDFVHLAPGVHLAGTVRVSEGAFLGIGSVVIPGVHIGAWATVGAGSVVVCDVPAHSTVYGVPARIPSERR